MTDDFTQITGRIWNAAGGPAQTVASRSAGPGNLTVSGPRQVLPSVFDVTGLAVASVAAPTPAPAEVHAPPHGTPPNQVHLDRPAGWGWPPPGRPPGRAPRGWMPPPPPAATPPRSAPPRSAPPPEGPRTGKRPHPARASGCST